MTGPRQLNWPGCLNVRDLGGLPTSDGGQIRARALVRSDNLDRLTTAGIAAVRAAGVSRIVDVRTAWECQHYPTPFTGDPIWRNAPLADVDAPDESDRSLSEQYISSLDRSPGRIAAAVGWIADAPSGCVVVHCHAGKDRAGIIVAVTLSLAGVPAADIAADYAIVGDSTVDVATLAGAAPTTEALPSELEAPRPETMLQTLAHLDSRYGGVAKYLAHGGLADHVAVSVRSRLCDEHHVA